MTWAVRIAAAAIVGWAVVGASAQAPAPKATTVIRYAVPSDLPNFVQYPAATCAESRAAWFRDDARRCSVESNEFDPCFKHVNGLLWCVSDPSKKPGGSVVAVADPRTLAPSHPRTQGLSHTAWLFELADGSTCRPLADSGREIERLTELYSCKWGTDGNADAVLGELETSLPVWTIRKVLINKKVDPQTIKSFVVAPVKTVWQ